MQDWKIFALASAFFAGLTAVLAKIGVQNIPSNLATLFRTAVILVFTGALVGLRKEWRHPWLLDKRCLVFLVLSGLATGLSWLCYYRALQTGPVSLVAPVDKLSLLFALFFSFVFLGERLNAYEWAGAALIFAGTLLIVFK